MRHEYPALVALLVVAGCIGAAPPAGDRANPDVPDLIRPFDEDHDHNDPALHGFSDGLAQVGYHNLVPGSDGTRAADRGDWIGSEVIVRGTYAYLAYVGAPWLVAIVDIADAEHPTLVGTYETGNAWGVDVAVSEDGDWIFVCVYPSATGELFAQDYLLQRNDPPSGAPLPSLTVIDARDKARPVLSDVLPFHGLGPHTAEYHRYPDGREIIFANQLDPVPGNMIVVVEVVPTPVGTRTLKPLTTISLTEGSLSGPHDVDVAEHPITGRTILYGAGWDEGFVTIDVTDPEHPTKLAKIKTFPPGEEVQLHDAHPFQRLVGGRHFTITTPEIPAGPSTGHLRIFDTTDPADPFMVGSWVLPGNYTVDQKFVFSPHNFQFLPDGRVAWGHGHAGVWVLDWLGPGGADRPDPEYLAHPRAVAYYVPHETGAKQPAWSPLLGTPWVWGTAIDDRGLIWASDVSSGIHGLTFA